MPSLKPAGGVWNVKSGDRKGAVLIGTLSSSLVEIIANAHVPGLT